MGRPRVVQALGLKDAMKQWSHQERVMSYRSQRFGVGLRKNRTLQGVVRGVWLRNYERGSA